MKQCFDLAKLYRRAVARMPSEIDGVAPLPAPSNCPYELDELLREM